MVAQTKETREMAEKIELKASISVGDAAKLLGLDSHRRIQQLAAEGVFDRVANGRYDTVSVIQGYIAFLREERKETTQTAGRARVDNARALEIELKNAQRNNDLVEFDEAAAVVDEMAGLLKSEFSGFPAAMTRDPTMRKKLQDGIDGVFKRAHEGIVKTLGALKSSGSAVGTDTEDDSE